MKIAFVYDVMYPDTIGGVEKRIFEIGTRLAEKGHEIHLFPMRPSNKESIAVSNGIIIHEVCRPIGLYTGGRRSVFQALWYSIHLFPVLLKTRVDIIDCQNFPYFPVIVSRIVGFCKKERCIITWHECWGDFWYQYLGIAGAFGRITEIITLLLSDLSISVSCHTSELMKKEGYQKESFIIPNGINLTDISVVPPGKNPVDVIFIGRLIPEKQPELFIKAIKILKSDFPRLSCLIIGDGPMMQEIKTQIQDLELSENVTLCGFVKDYNEVISRMKTAKVFVLPSKREGFGIVCIEAMACGLPIVTTRYPLNAASEHVLPGSGYLADPNAPDVASGIKQYLRTRPDQNVMQNYVQKHDWDKISSLLESIYQKIL
ncbi:MAG: glycosyltransferase family 4 protein [Methanomicrobiales archaeon]|nr:glycosyltransferase family 4 protein [Methanomicrobiales archaeon]